MGLMLAGVGGVLFGAALLILQVPLLIMLLLGLGIGLLVVGGILFFEG